MDSGFDKSQNPYRPSVDVDDADQDLSDSEDETPGREWLLAAILISLVIFGLLLAS